MTRGLFITFEGGEGSGKSTQARWLSRVLTKYKIPNMLTFEPGDTQLGVELRGLLLNGRAGKLCPKTEALLFAADRAQHVETIIRPNLDAGKVVICDRYIASSVAYQAYAGALDAAQIRSISEWASDELYPDMTFLLDVDPQVGLNRVDTGSRNLFEAKTLDFHNRVREGYRQQKTEGWIEIPGNLRKDDIHDRVVDHVLVALRAKEDSSVETTLTFTGESPDPVAVMMAPNATQHGLELCKRNGCDNPYHQYGHAAEDLSDLAAFEQQ